MRASDTHTMGWAGNSVLEPCDRRLIPFLARHAGIIEEQRGNTLKVFARFSTLGRGKEILKYCP